MNNISWKTTGAGALALAVALGTAGVAQAEPVENAVVAFLMPDLASTRYEEHDYPGFAAEMEKLCPTCKVLYHNADADAARQQEQFNSVIAQGAKVIVLDAADTTAAASLVKLAQSQGIYVISYDRPITEAQADYYISFDNVGIGKAIAESLVQHLEATGVSPEDGGLLQINGQPGDNAAILIGEGLYQGLATGEYKTLAEFWTPEWAPPKAQQWTSGQITRFGDQILGIAAANDGTAGGAIAALKAAGVDPLPPVIGNDATIAALQLIIAGDQYNTISKPGEIVGAAAAQVAVQLLSGEKPEADSILFDTPSKLFTPTVVTAENLKAEIIDKGIVTADVLCVDRYAEGCKKLGITN
jgi:D-xylose transport system substrate-binding protein